MRHHRSFDQTTITAGVSVGRMTRKAMEAITILCNRVNVRKAYYYFTRSLSVLYARMCYVIRPVLQAEINKYWQLLC